MTTFTLFFVVVGVGCAVRQVMRFALWLDGAE